MEAHRQCVPAWDWRARRPARFPCAASSAPIAIARRHAHRPQQPFLHGRRRRMRVREDRVPIGRESTESRIRRGRSRPTPSRSSCLPAERVLPATQSLYRSYNNGAHGDPNHHYSTNARILQAIPGWMFEGLVMCLPKAPTATAVGVAAGAAASATIGQPAARWPRADGKLTLTFPAGALAAATTIGIQPITNFAHGKVGAAYRADAGRANVSRCRSRSRSSTPTQNSRAPTPEFLSQRSRHPIDSGNGSARPSSTKPPSR